MVLSSKMNRNKSVQNQVRGSEVQDCLLYTSKYYFCRIFREVTGATVLEYLTNVRLTRAGRLLVESSLAIQEIAQKLSLIHIWILRMLRTREGSAVHPQHTPRPEDVLRSLL